MKPAYLVACVGLLLLACPAAAQAPEPPMAGADIGTDPAAPPETDAEAAAAPVPRRSAFVPFDETPWPAAPIPAYPSTPRSSIGTEVLPVQAEVIEPAWPEHLPAVGGAPAMTIVPRRTGLLPRLVETLSESGEPTALLQEGAPGMLPSTSELPTEPLQLPAQQPLAVEPVLAAPEPHWPRFWTSTEFLLWLVPRGPLPLPLLTTGPAQNFPPPGVLDDPNTDILIGADQLKYGNYPGGRLTMGCWLTRSELIALEANAFWAGSNGINRTLPPSIAESGVLARPFINALDGTTAVALISFPEVFDGLLHIYSDSRMYGGEVNLIGKFIRREHWNMDVIAGYRYFELAENLEVANEAFTLQDDVVAFLNELLPSGSTVNFSDKFATENRFQGAQLGIRTAHCLGAMTLAVTGKVAVGQTRQTVQITGSTTRILPDGTTDAYPAGVFAVGSNSGTFVRNELTVIPQLQVYIGYQCCDWLRVFFSYEFLWWSQVLRPGAQIDPFLNPLLIPTNLDFDPTAAPARPLVPFDARSFWAQGISIGMEFKY